MQPIDGLAEEYMQLVVQAELANDKVSKLRQLLIERVLIDGAHPPRATKTKALAGEIYELRVSQPTEVSVDTGIALRIWRACERAGMPDLFGRLFRKVETFVLAGGAEKILREKLPEGAPRNLRTLYARAVTVKDLSPSLEVRRREKKDAEAA